MPPQHGVWAMLLLPYLAGLRYGAVWLDVPLLIGWLSGLLMSHHALLAVKTGRWRRVRSQVLAFGAVCAACLVPVVAIRPALAWFAPAFAVFMGVNAAFCRWGNERATLNGVASVTMASMMAMIVPVTAGLPWTTGVPIATATWLYLTGTVVHVKAMIREYGSRRQQVISVTYHAVALAAATALQPWFAVPFSLMLARTVVMPRRPRMRAPVIGIVEVVLTLILLGFLLTVPLGAAAA
ncbi:YwiC-like family protein [Demequina litorisediminis]|uniref:YwiC-like family protein n=1 Tax=Demequina litorisediminis TaxID=1849022 RepID=UPI0024E08DDB|nr:YwiC-like family protein [Demequina litorisediminis]